jgi:hypothetical protein
MCCCISVTLHSVHISTATETLYEEDDHHSVRSAFKTVPWNTKKTSDLKGGINKQNNFPKRDNRPKVDRCCKCGRYHAPTIDTCLMFDHPTANQTATWPEGKEPLRCEKPEEWSAWLGLV